jgi:protein-tyrosine phosphatase
MLAAVFASLRKLFGSDRPDEVRPSIQLRERDCHAHVIPGVDDGSRDLDESLAMLRLLRDEGVRTVVSTSHIFAGRFPNEPEVLRRSFDALAHAADRANVGVTLEFGAEHYLDETLRQRVEKKRVVAFGRERYVLFEAATGQAAPVGLFDVVHALRDRGYVPLLAHVERYGWLRGDAGREIIEDLRCAGARFQVNRTVGDLNVIDGSSRGRFLAMLLAHGWIDEVGSDLHRATPEGRPYVLDRPLSS